LRSQRFEPASLRRGSLSRSAISTMRTFKDLDLDELSQVKAENFSEAVELQRLRVREGNGGGAFMMRNPMLAGGELCARVAWVVRRDSLCTPAQAKMAKMRTVVAATTMPRRTQSIPNRLDVASVRSCRRRRQTRLRPRTASPSPRLRRRL
jgi:hypothetical protein